jgi:sarcosine oxidase subunit alpha
MTVLNRTTAFAWYPGNMIALAERVTDHLARPNPNLPRERLWLVRARRVIIATGAIERPSVFPGNDRPGIILAGAAATYLHRYGVIPGRRIVVSTSHDSAYSVALALAAAGVTVAGILDRRDTIDASLREQTHAAGIPVHTGTQITATGGRRRVRFVRTDHGPAVIRCDTVLMSDGWTPSVQMFSQSRGQLRFDPASGTFLPAASEPSVGACAGTFGLAACLAAGHEAGGGKPKMFEVSGEPPAGGPVPPSPGQPHRKAFVDFQNDVTTKDLAIATEEGFRAIEHVKRYTTTGMATDQGKTSNLNALATVAALTGRPMPAIGLTTFRPPYTPVTFGTFAGAARGALFDPVRRTPIDDQDAVFEDAGTWQRAHYFPRNGETMQQAVARECLAVRNDLGMFDASTLGKIEVVGPDAAAFLNLMYTGDFARLAPGRCKYGLLLGEDGFIRDDGVIARLAPDRFHVTTTTGGAAFVLHHMEDYLQTEFPAMRVWLTSVTEQWAVIALQGPRAATALAPFLDDTDLATMPHLSVREAHFASVPIRLFRVSFTGELGFEINFPAGFARSAWDLLRETGATRYGTEAMHVLRAEKGFIVVGKETDGTVVPGDLGLDRTIAQSKPDFVGKRSLMRPDMQRNDRKQLVGLLTVDPKRVLEEGTQLIDTGTVSLGHVTSAYHSGALDRSIALALIAGGRSRIGSKLRVPLPGGVVEVTVTEPIFYDPAGDRMTRPVTHGARAIRPALVATSFTPPPAQPCAEVTLATAPAAGKRCIRTRQQLAPALRANRTALWLGPDEYLVTDDTPIPACSIVPSSIVDVSHRTVAFRVTGPRAAWCLNAFCPLDLETAPEDFCTRTLFGKAEIVLWHLGANGFHIETPRSYAPYVWGLLEEARREFLPSPTAC